MTEYLRTSEYDDVLCSVRQCAQSLGQVTEDQAEWKWVILSLHSAVQGAMVCHLSGTAKLGALSCDCVAAHLAWHDRDRRGQIGYEDCSSREYGIPARRIKAKRDMMPEQFLADFKTMLKRLQRLDKRIETAGRIVMLDRRECHHMLLLNQLRRRMTHFAPGSWSIQLAGLPRMVHLCAGIVLKIAADPWPFRHMKKPSYAAMLGELGQIQLKASELDRQYNPSVKTS